MTHHLDRVRSALQTCYQELYGYADAGRSTIAMHLCDEIQRAMAVLGSYMAKNMQEISREQTVVTWIRTSEKMPEPYRTVLVDAGLAVWTGEEWISETGKDSGRTITWGVLYWSRLITAPYAYVALPRDEKIKPQPYHGDEPFDLNNPLDYVELRDFYIAHNGLKESEL